MGNFCQFRSQNPKISEARLVLNSLLCSFSHRFIWDIWIMREELISPASQQFTTAAIIHIKIPLLIYPSIDILSPVWLNFLPSVLERIIVRNSHMKTASAFLKLWIKCVAYHIINYLMCNYFCDKLLLECREQENVLLDTKVYNFLH